MGTQSARSGRVFAKIDLCCLVVCGRRSPVCFDQTPRFIGIFLAHQDYRPSHARKHFLDRVDRGHVGINADRVEQPLDHQGLGFLLAVKHLDQLLVWVGSLPGGGRGTGTFCHKLLHWRRRGGSRSRDVAAVADCNATAPTLLRVALPDRSLVSSRRTLWQLLSAPNARTMKTTKGEQTRPLCRLEGSDRWKRGGTRKRASWKMRTGSGGKEHFTKN